MTSLTVVGLVRFQLKSVAVCIPAYVSYRIQVVEDYFKRGLCVEEKASSG